jgi:hypothetical protein
LPTWLYFYDGYSSLYFTAESKNKADAGSYTIKITANPVFYSESSSSRNLSTTFNITLTIATPVLKGLSSFQTILVLSDLTDDAYSFGPLTGLSYEYKMTLTYTVEPSYGNSYFEVD